MPLYWGYKWSSGEDAMGIHYYNYVYIKPNIFSTVYGVDVWGADAPSNSSTLTPVRAQTIYYVGVDKIIMAPKQDNLKDTYIRAPEFDLYE